MSIWSLRPVASTWNRGARVLYSTTTGAAKTQATVDNKAFSKTLLLPKTSFPLWTDPAKSEKPFQTRTSEKLYRWQWENAKGPLFVLHDGPPYANGDLHMGHALNKIIKDIINRFHVLMGRRVHYIPGWDCHGLPIENKALQELGKDLMSSPPNVIRQAAMATATREIQSQKEQFQHFGIMADWSPASTYRTLDHDYEIRQLRIFQKMLEKGLIYRQYRPVHYSPSSRSALAEAELVYRDDHVSRSVYIAFEVDRESHVDHPLFSELVASEHSIQLLVWTTTPWTLTANMGIAVHPKLKYVVLRQTEKHDAMSNVIVVGRDRMDALAEILGPVEILAEIEGSDLVGLPYRPLFSNFVPPVHPLRVIIAPHVTAESGTGLVHCAPAHGAEDYQAFLALGLLSSKSALVCHVDGEGKFRSEVADVVGEDAAQRLVGLEVLNEGSTAVLDLLKDQGCIFAVKPITHRYPYDWKTSKPIIVTATSQWFADLGSIKDDALRALQSITFFPPVSRNRLESFIQSRTEWCISRQRVWGVPIPAVYHLPTGRAVLNSVTLDHILSVLEKKGVAYWWDGPVEDFIPPSLINEGEAVSEVWVKGTDTMDVWFDSGTSWSMLKEMIEQYRQENPSRKYLADICLEGSDQHRGWFQSQLLTAMGAAASPDERVSPYGTLITHGMVLDQDGKKMSKSLGNIVSPLTIVFGGKDKKKEPAYGADVLRLWAATVEYWRDMSIGPTVLSQVAESLRKIRNSLRFILGNIKDDKGRGSFQRVPKHGMGLAERYIMHELYNLEQTALDGYSSYNFPKVVNALTNFANVTLSSLYFDITKDCLYANSVTSHERRAVVTVLETVLDTMTSALAPILPHLVEEIHEVRCADGSSAFTRKWTPLHERWKDADAAQEMNELLRIRGAVLGLLEDARGDKLIKSSLEAEVDIVIPVSDGNNTVIDLLRREEQFLKTLFIVSDAVVIEEGDLGTSCPSWVYMKDLPIPGSDEGIVVRVRPTSLHKCPRCWTYTREEHERLCSRCTLVVT